MLLGHIYGAQLNPWVVDWQSDRHDDAFPVRGKVVARRYCWGDSASAGGIKGAVAEGKSFGVLTFSWIWPRAKRSQTYAIFMVEIPTGWRGVADVAAGAGKILATEKQTGSTISLKADRI